MSIATVRNAVISDLKADPDVITNIGASKVDYGLGKNITEDMLPQCIRVVQRGQGDTKDDAEEFAETGDGYSYFWCKYPLLIVVIFQETDAKAAEDLESTYNQMVRKVQYGTLGGIVTKMEFGRTMLRTRDEDETIRFVVIEAWATTLEQENVR